jgi:hypothetical protein
VCASTCTAATRGARSSVVNTKSAEVPTKGLTFRFLRVLKTDRFASAP